MNKKDLQELVRKAIQEAINERTYAGIAASDDVQKDPAYNALNTDAKLDIKNKLAKGGSVNLGENEIDEMANVAVRYQLSPDADAATFTGKKNRIITAMQATGEPMSKVDVAGELGYDKQNPINADFMALVADGIIVPAGEQRAPRLNRPQPAAPEVGGEDGEEGPTGYEGPEGGVEGEMSDADIEASFAKAMGSGDEEPEAGEIETTDISGAKMSDEDYEAFMKYTDLENRLAKVKSDLLKAKRYRSTPGDLADQPSNAVNNLRDLKTRIQAKMDDLLAGNAYLQARKAKLDKKAAPEETEEEPLDEWVKGRMQYYAGIRK